MSESSRRKVPRSSRIWACTETSSAEGRLVEDEEAGFRRERAGDADPLLLPAREFVRVTVPEGRAEG